jgi:hypothetical protein
VGCAFGAFLWSVAPNQLFRDRQEGDYTEFTVFDAPYVQEKIEACEEFLAALRPLLTSLPLEP